MGSTVFRMSFAELAIPTTLPLRMLSVRNSAQAIDFYKTAFGATEVFRVNDGDVVVPSSQ